MRKKKGAGYPYGKPRPARIPYGVLSRRAAPGALRAFRSAPVAVLVRECRDALPVGLESLHDVDQAPSQATRITDNLPLRPPPGESEDQAGGEDVSVGALRNSLAAAEAIGLTYDGVKVVEVYY